MIVSSFKQGNFRGAYNFEIIKGTYKNQVTFGIELNYEISYII